MRKAADISQFSIHGRIAVNENCELRTVNCSSIALRSRRTDRWRPIPPLAFEDLVLRGPMVVPSAWFIAVDGGRYVGESYLRRYAKTFPRLATQGFTCTRRDHRGMGIARHLKLLCMLWAKEHGVGQIRTWNDAKNSPMLGLNGSLGFRSYATEYKLWKAVR